MPRLMPPISPHPTWFEAEHVENVDNDEMGNDGDDDDEDDDDDDKKRIEFSCRPVSTHRVKVE